MHCGASVRELYSALAFHIHYPSHLCDNSLIPRPSPPPTIACKTTGGERLGKRRRRISNVCQCSWSNITWVFANLGFIVHTLCHYCGMIATAADNMASKHLEAA